MLYQVQWLDNQNGEWDVVANENGNEYFGKKEEAEDLQIQENERYPMNQTRIVNKDDDNWI